MAKGEVKEIPDKAVASDLLSCGYIVTVGEGPAPTNKPKKKRTPKGG